MTRVDVAATRCAVLRVVSLSIVALFSLALAACSNSDVTGSTGPSLSAPAPQAAPVAFVQIIGAPPAVTSKLKEAVDASARDRNLSLVGEKEAEYTVRGYLVAAPDAKGAKLSYIWDISDKTGKRVNRLQGFEVVGGRKGGDPWSQVDDEALTKVALRTTTDLAEWLAKRASAPAEQVAAAAPAAPPPTVARQARAPSVVQPASASPAHLAPVTASMTPLAETTGAPAATATFVAAVAGAPGDGPSSLSAAMRRHLVQQGVKIAERQTPDAYTVVGVVELKAAEDGQQPITIKWYVRDPAGKQLANAVVQRNKIPAGSLDAAWGPIADAIATEAARKVAELLPKPSS